MISRKIWLKKLEVLWQKRPIIWLTGVRRVGKTTLSRMLEAEYFNCDLPSNQERLNNPEYFFKSFKPGTRIILDEVHQLKSPSDVLKIAADEFPKIKILATGSSTLSATKKFRDSLTGRKSVLYLSPVLWSECINSFNVTDLRQRLLRGGLPGMLLAETFDQTDYSEWIDSFYARDISELFSIRNRSGFLQVLKLLLIHSGGMLDLSNIAKLAQLSSPTVKTYIESMQIAHAVILIPPYHGGNKREITKMPKCYAFDTGFVAYAKGWDSIRSADEGILWEHLVLDTIRFCFDSGSIFYWRDKSNREIDFVVKRNSSRIDIIECKMNADKINTNTIKTFRSIYPEGKNFLLSPYADKSYSILKDKIEIQITDINDFLNNMP
jgi:uncharacterized protein